MTQEQTLEVVHILFNTGCNEVLLSISLHFLEERILLIKRHEI